LLSLSSLINNGRWYDVKQQKAAQRIQGDKD